MFQEKKPWRISRPIVNALSIIPSVFPNRCKENGRFFGLQDEKRRDYDPKYNHRRYQRIDQLYMSLGQTNVQKLWFRTLEKLLDGGTKGNILAVRVWAHP